MAIRAGALWRLTAAFSSLRFDGETLTLTGRRTEQAPLHEVRAVSLRRSLFGSRLSIELTDHRRFDLFGLRHAPAVAVTAELERSVGRAQRRIAEESAPWIHEVTAAAEELFGGPNWIRLSQVESLRPSLQRVADFHGAFGHCLDAATGARAAAAVELLRQLDDRRRATNERYAHVEAAESLPLLVEQLGGGHPPTDEQMQAIVTGEDCTLVLAGAGSGKTTTIVGKVLHLVARRGAAPESILVLAFNRSAAAEIRERLGHAPGVRVMTFHAFGRDVLSAVEGAAPSLASFVQDDSALSRLLAGILEELLLAPTTAHLVVEYFVSYLTPSRSAFEFDSLGEYYEYVRSFDLRTLTGVPVKSFEELQIANFLAVNGVKFHYEAPYQHATASREYRQYRPDFYLPEHDIYIEHFGVDRTGGTAPGIDADRYAERMGWARRTHAERGTALIETFTWQRQQGTLLQDLERALRARGVTLQPVPPEQLLAQLRERGTVNRLTALLATFLSHYKSNGASLAPLHSRAGDLPDSPRLRAFLRLFEAVLERYEATLRTAGEVDFHDLIQRAAQYVRSGQYPSPFRHILVDEFQDISRGRAALLRALGDATGAELFVVGDDWQSIYRFAGSDVSILRDCERHFGHTARRDLTRTFRFSRGILGVASRFVTANPAQTRRDMRAESRLDDGGVTVVAGEPTQALRGILRTLPDGASVRILGRYRNSRKQLTPQNENPRLRVSFTTVHAAKGTEADYVIVLDLKNGAFGFPSHVEDDPILDLVLPEPEGFPHAEERRLFYVAMTRARTAAYLVTDASHPSDFVEELREDGYPVKWEGDSSREPTGRCPRCRTGRLVRDTHRALFRCANQPLCDFETVQCPRCEQGALLPGERAVTCSDRSCRHEERLCPRCRRGLLREQTGRYGPFLGCSEFRAELPCRYTESIGVAGAPVSSPRRP